MAGTITLKRLESPASRRRLKRGRQAHWTNIIPRRVHLGWQRWPDKPEGRWLLRKWLGDDKYSTIALGRADDTERADGDRILSYDQALAAARAAMDEPKGRVHRLTVRQAVQNYIQFKEAQGQNVGDLLSRSRAHILPVLGNLVVEDLTAEKLRTWLSTLAALPKQTRPKAGKAQFKSEPNTDEDVRRRRASANRVLTYLKAALNHAYDEGHVSQNSAWGRRLKPYRDVEVARVRYLSVAEATRLINACDPEFRPLVRAALETGCRFSELTRVQVHDFNRDAGTLTIAKSKSGKARHLSLTPEATQFFRQHCAGRQDLMFTHADGSPWKPSEQARPMAAAAERAKLKGVTFHVLRHSWASLAAMAGVSLQVIAQNLGHSAGSPVTQRHYAHLSPSHVRDQIQAGAPRYAVKIDKKIVPLR